MDNIHELHDYEIQILTLECYKRFFVKFPEMNKIFTSQLKEYVLEDFRYHIEHINLVSTLDNLEIFSDYSSWTRIVLESRGIETKQLINSYNIIKDIFGQFLESGLKLKLYRVIDSGLKTLSNEMKTPNSFLNSVNPFNDKAKSFFEILESKQRMDAINYVKLLIKNKEVSLQQLYLNIFQPILYEIGRLWELNLINVAQEHYYTGVIQWVMAQTYPEILSIEKIGKNILTTCVGKELHELGMRMLTDIFEINGWNTKYLGANVPNKSIIQMISKNEFDIIAISASIPTHIELVKQLIDEIKKNEGIKIKIIVGGYIFNQIPNLWKEIGADGSAPDALSAIDVAEKLLVKKSN